MSAYSIQAVVAIAVLGWLVSSGLGCLALINPNWFGIPTRFRSSIIFFGIASLCFVVGVFATIPLLSERSLDGSEVIASTSQQKTAPTMESKIEIPDYITLSTLLVNFEGLTDLQQDEWNSDHEWKYWVSGTCTVSDVVETNVFSEVTDMAYEVTCEIVGGNRVVLFYPVEKREYVLGLNKGNAIEFAGRLKLIKNWGFWVTGYVTGE